MDFTFDNIRDTFEDFIRIENNEIDISKYRFIEPIGVAILKSLKLENQNITIIGDKSNPSYSYINTLNKEEYDPTKSYIPLEIIKNESIDMVTERIVSKILSLSHDNRSFNEDDLNDIKQYIKYCVGEIINNADKHALSPIGAIVVGQYFPTIKKLQICVVDRGTGFLKNIRRKYNVNNEKEAIKKSLEKGVTSSPLETMPYRYIENAGIGLYALNKILEKTKGRFLIISNDGGIIMDYHKNEEYDFNASKSWKGSIVAFEFFEDNISFSWEEFMKIYIRSDEEDIF